MKRNLVDFTRGSQLLGHFGFMFAAFRPQLAAIIGVASGIGKKRPQGQLKRDDASCLPPSATIVGARAPAELPH